MHGGNAQHAIGVNNKSFKHGRHSKYLPAKLNELYVEARSNPELLEMADHIALLEAHMQEILATSTAGEAVPKWSDLAEAFGRVETDILSGDLAAAVPGMERIHQILESGMNWDRTWDQVTSTMEQLRRLTDTETKRKRELNQMVPVERVIILMAAVGEAVKRHVKDPAQIQAVYRELAELHGGDNVPDSRGVNALTRVGPEVIDVTPRKSKSQMKREAAANAVR